MAQLSNQCCCSGFQDASAPKLFKALCDPTRVAILVMLARCEGELTVSEVAGCCPIDLSVVSRHLAMLKEAGVLDSEKRGKEVYYKVRPGALVASLRAMADELEACCPPQKENVHE
jgi:DNA-binding transcriptional ArsR family regulator